MFNFMESLFSKYFSCCSNLSSAALLVSVTKKWFPHPTDHAAWRRSYTIFKSKVPHKQQYVLARPTLSQRIGEKPLGHLVCQLCITTFSTIISSDVVVTETWLKLRDSSLQNL